MKRILHVHLDELVLDDAAGVSSGTVRAQLAAALRARAAGAEPDGPRAVRRAADAIRSRIDQAAADAGWTAPFGGPTLGSSDGEVR